MTNANVIHFTHTDIILIFCLRYYFDCNITKLKQTVLIHLRRNANE